VNLEPTADIVKQNSRMLAIKHEQEKEAEMEQLDIKAVLEQVEKDKAWVEFLIQDLTIQKETTERAIEILKDVISNISQNTPSMNESERVARLISWWGAFSDLISTKSPMMDNAVKALNFENNDFREKVISTYSLPLVGPKLEILENMSLQTACDTVAIDEVFESACKGGLRPDQLSLVSAWLYETSNILSKRTKDLTKEHYQEKGKLLYKTKKQFTKD
jgi:hypothetical protein